MFRLGFQKKSSFLIVGFFLLAGAFSLKGYQTWQSQRLSFAEPPKLVAVVEEGDLPARIIIPKVKIDLPISPGVAKNDQWEISEAGASYLLGSGMPGRAGNVVIYGHNKNSLLGPIRWLEEGDEIKIITKKDQEFLYRVVETKTVSPKEVEVLLSTKEPTLTLYTCTGFLDRERLVMVAKLP